MNQQHRIQGWAIYLRCANVKSAKRSFASQLQNIERSVLSESKLPVIAKYEDTGTPNSDSWTQLLEDAKLKKFSHVVISSLDRFGRNIPQAEKRIDTLRVAGIELVSAFNFDLVHNSIEPIQSLDPKYMLALEKLIIAHTRDIMSQRIREGLAYRKNQASQK